MSSRTASQVYRNAPIDWWRREWWYERSVASTWEWPVPRVVCHHDRDQSVCWLIDHVSGNTPALASTARQANKEPRPNRIADSEDHITLPRNDLSVAMKEKWRLRFPLLGEGTSGRICRFSGPAWGRRVSSPPDAASDKDVRDATARSIHQACRFGCLGDHWRHLHGRGRTASPPIASTADGTNHWPRGVTRSTVSDRLSAPAV